MQTHHFSRKRRQFAYASKKVNRWIDSGQWYQLTETVRKKWTQKMRRLADILRAHMSYRAWKKALAGLTIILGLQAPVSGQLFAPPQENPFGYVPGALSTYSQPTLADIDADGDLDIFIGNQYGLLTYYENVGDRNQLIIAPATLLPFGFLSISTQDFVAPAFGDLDGDGDLDLLAGTEDSDWYYFPNIGSATQPQLGAVVVNPFGLDGSNTTYQYPALIDLDQDNDLDLLWGTENGEFVYQENTGSAIAPAFGPQQVNPFGLAPNGANQSPTLGDFDLDGDLDILATNANGTINYFPNTGTAVQPSFGPVITNPFGLSLSAPYSKLHSADLDSDGDLDLLLGEPYTIVLRENIGTPSSPTFAPPIANAFGLRRSQPFVIPAEVDIDGDGDLDLFLGEYDGRLSFHENVGTPTQGRLIYRSNDLFGLTLPTNNNLIALTFADLDLDGDQDALMGRAYGSMDYFENVGRADSAAFAAPLTNPFGLTNLYNFNFPDFADLDHDGDLDLLVGDYNGLQFFENVGSPTLPAFGPVQTNPFGLSLTNYLFPSLGDMDGDGDLDLVAGGSYTNFISYYENVGSCDSAAFGPQQINPFGLQRGGYFSFTTTADFDQDGDIDVFDGQPNGVTRLLENIDPNAGFEQVDSVTICLGDTVIFQGDTLSLPGVYTQTFNAADGCDSTIALVLLTGNTEESFSQTICQGDTAFFGGQPLTISGTYTQVLTNALGCDSTLRFSLSVIAPTVDSLFATICAGDRFQFGDTTFAQTGVYVQKAQSALGCDSTTVLSLSVNTIDISVSQAQETLTANASNATYQWLACDQGFAPIMGETSATFSASVNGRYAVQITDTQTNCIDTSACIAVTNISNDLALAGMTVSPTLINSQMTVALGSLRDHVALALLDGQGRVVRTELFRSTSHIQWDLANISPGIYWMRIEVEDRPYIIKVVKL